MGTIPSELSFLGLLFMMAAATVFMPMAIWDRKTRRYVGFFNRSAGGIILSVMLAAVVGGITDGLDSSAILERINYYVFVVIVLSRVTVEFLHYEKTKVWLHRNYHKMTGHDDPRQP